MPFTTGLTTTCLVALLMLPACGDSGPDQAVAAPCPSPTAVEAPGLPRTIPLAEWGTITRFEARDGFVGAEAVADTTIVELYPEIVRTLTGAGYSLLGGDNEGFEAEISFLDRKEHYINIILRGGACEDQVRVRVLIEKRRQA